MSSTNDLRMKHPSTAFKADYDNSRACAIKLFCKECVGGSPKLVKECQIQSCFLWPYRGNGETTRSPGVIPSIQEYAKVKPKVVAGAHKRVQAKQSDDDLDFSGLDLEIL